ncbi:MAG: carotenoid oxygenase family protein [Deltaproteobacteria bacterium]|nr:carotenoid oxygenase family protein [Deltaproteobacteria bacterium]
MGLIGALIHAGAKAAAVVQKAPSAVVNVARLGKEDWVRTNERAARWGWLDSDKWTLGKYPEVPDPATPPTSLNYASHNEQLGVHLNVVSGALPATLKGVLYIQVTTGTGSTGLPRPGNVPVFNSDGCLLKVSFDGADAIADKVYIKTASWLAERLTRGDKSATPLLSTGLAARLLYTVGIRHNLLYRFTSWGMMRRSVLLGARNMVNTGLVPFLDPTGLGARLLVTWDAGTPWEVETDTLKAATPVGSVSEWRPAAGSLDAFPTTLTTAHPVWDGYLGEGFFVDYARGAGQLLHETAIAAVTMETLGAYGEVAERLLATLPNLGPGSGLPGSQFVTWAVAWLNALAPGYLPYELDTFTNLKRWSGDGALQDYRLVWDGLDVQFHESCHQMGLTSDHVLLLDTGVKVQIAGLLGGLVAGLRGSRTLRALLLRRVRERAPLYIVSRAKLASADQERLDRISAGELDTTPDLDVVRVDLPGQASHLIADYALSNGNIVVYVAHSEFTDVGEYTQVFDRRPLRSSQGVVSQAKGLPHIAALQLGRLSRYEIDPTTGAIVSERSLAEAPFTRTLALLAEHAEGRTAPATHTIEHLYWCSTGFCEGLMTEELFRLYEGNSGHLTSPEELRREIASLTSVPCTLFRLDTATMSIEDSFEFDLGDYVSSPQFVPKPPSGTGALVHPQMAGWLIVTVFPKNHPTIPNAPMPPQVQVFDAADLAIGPICVLQHSDLRFGYSVHTAWLDETEVGPRQATYKVPPADLTSRMWDVISATFLDYEVVPRL